MTTTLPALDSTMHTASVTYACTFGATTAAGGTAGGSVLFAVPKPVQFVFEFETGQTQPTPGVDLFNVTTDLTWFDQTTTEASIAAALNTICAAIATLLGVTTAVIQATVSVQRSWRVSPNQVGSAAPVQVPSAPVVYNEVMAYPAAAAKLTRLSAGNS